MDADYHFQLTNERGHIVDLDNSSDHGGNNKGASPMELLLMGLAGCSGIDIIAILKNQYTFNIEHLEDAFLHF